jgi:hypothetical protein
VSSSPVVTTKEDHSTSIVYQDHLYDTNNSIALETMTCFQLFQAMCHQELGNATAGKSVCINPAYATQKCCEHIFPVVSNRLEKNPFFLHPLCSSYSCRGRRNQMEDRVLILHDLNTFCHLPTLPYQDQVNLCLKYQLMLQHCHL